MSDVRDTCPEESAEGRSSPAGIEGSGRRNAGSFLILGLFAIAFGGLVVIVLLSPPERLYDERRYIDYVGLAAQYGLSAALLERLPGAVGPLYGFFHLTLRPVTGLEPVLMRLATVGLLVVLFGLIAVALRQTRNADTLPMAASVLVVPMTWVMSGMALTTLPALVFIAANIVLQLRGIAALEAGKRPLALFAAAGILLGIAIWGRQTAGVLVVPPLLLALIDRRFLAPVLLQAAIAGAMSLPLLAVWQGPNPPLDDTLPGFDPDNVVLTLGYLFTAFLLLAQHPRWLFGRRSLGALAAIFAVNGMLAFTQTFPLASIMDNYLSEPAMRLYGTACGSILLWLGGAFFVWIANVVWQHRRDARTVLIHCSLLVLAVVPIAIGNEFSSRYATVALPYLVLVAAPHRGSLPATAAKALIGCALGICVLAGYYWDPLTSDIVRMRLR